MKTKDFTNRMVRKIERVDANEVRILFHEGPDLILVSDSCGNIEMCTEIEKEVTTTVKERVSVK